MQHPAGVQQPPRRLERRVGGSAAPASPSVRRSTPCGQPTSAGASQARHTQPAARPSPRNPTWVRSPTHPVQCRAATASARAAGSRSPRSGSAAGCARAAAAGRRRRRSWWTCPRRGPRRQRKRGGFATKQAALDALAELQVDTARGLTVEPSKQTVGEYLAEWLAGARPRYRPTAWDTCRLHVERYIAAFDIWHVPLQRLTPVTVRGFLADLRERGRVRGDAPLSDKTVHNVYTTLRRALGDAVDDRLLARNPAAKAHTAPESPEQPT